MTSQRQFAKMLVSAARKSTPMQAKDKNHRIRQLITELIKELGVDPKQEGLRNTPHRVAEALLLFPRGYDHNPAQILLKASFNEQYDQRVLVKDIDFFSMCEHHLLPFYGKCHIACIPKGKVVGLSKIP